MKRLSEVLAAENRSRFMFELLVPPEKAQLGKVNGDRRAYDLELRPRLMVEAIRELQGAGVERMCGRWKASIAARIAGRSWRRHGTAAATMSAASFSAAPISETRWSPGEARAQRGSRLWPKIAARYREFVDLFEKDDNRPSTRPL